MNPARSKAQDRQACRDMIDAIRAMLGLDPLYGVALSQPTVIYCAAPWHFNLGPGNRRTDKTSET